MSVRNYAILWPDRKSLSSTTTAGGGNQLLSTGQHALDGAEHTGQLPETRISTTETDTALVLHPDGLGGVEWDTAAAGAGMFFDVTDYGAVADSSTDCRAAIVAADAAAALVQGTVFFPRSADSYYVLWSSLRHSLKPSAGVTWLGEGMFQSVIEIDPASTISTSTAGQPFIEIGSATAGVSNITIRDLGINVHHSTLGNSSNKFLQGIAAQHNTTGTAHSDDITIERVRVYDTNVGIVCGKGALTPSASNRFERWSVRDCVVELTANKAIEFDQSEDSEITGCVTINAQDGLQFINYTVRSVMYGNRVEYKDAGINLAEGISDCVIAENVCKAIAGGGIGLNGGLVIRRESYTSTGPTSSRVKIHHNIFDDSASDASAHKIGVQFATYTGNTGVGTFEDYEIYANTFIADINYLQDAWFPAKSQAVRLRVYDNDFTDEVMTHTDWVSAGTRFSRNHVGGDFTLNSDDWDLRGASVVDGTFTDNASGTIYDSSGATTLDGLTDVSAAAPVQGNALRWNGTAWVSTDGFVVIQAPTPVVTVGPPFSVAISSKWGIDGSGDPYYDSVAAASGEEAALVWDPLTEEYALVSCVPA